MAIEIVPALESLEFQPYLTEAGDIDPQWTGKIGIYGIFDRDRCLQYVGFSRDIVSSLRLHLVRVNDCCEWVKIFTIDKPSRSFLSEIQAAWWGDRKPEPEVLDRWEQPLNCLPWITEQEQHQLDRAATESDRDRLLKDLARRVEEEILAKLAARGVKFKVRFDPKRKNSGILDIKP
jgi:hypothetical protein